MTMFWSVMTIRQVCKKVFKIVVKLIYFSTAKSCQSNSVDSCIELALIRCPIVISHNTYCCCVEELIIGHSDIADTVTTRDKVTTQ